MVTPGTAHLPERAFATATGTEPAVAPGSTFTVATSMPRSPSASVTVSSAWNVPTTSNIRLGLRSIVVPSPKSHS